MKCGALNTMAAPEISRWWQMVKCWQWFFLVYLVYVGLLTTIWTLAVLFCYYRIALFLLFFFFFVTHYAIIYAEWNSSCNIGLCSTTGKKTIKLLFWRQGKPILSVCVPVHSFSLVSVSPITAFSFFFLFFLFIPIYSSTSVFRLSPFQFTLSNFSNKLWAHAKNNKVVTCNVRPEYNHEVYLHLTDITLKKRRKKTGSIFCISLIRT